LHVCRPAVAATLKKNTWEGLHMVWQDNYIETYIVEITLYDFLSENSILVESRHRWKSNIVMGLAWKMCELNFIQGGQMGQERQSTRRGYFLLWKVK
jgi:hypothetical protein